MALTDSRPTPLATPPATTPGRRRPGRRGWSDGLVGLVTVGALASYLGPALVRIGYPYELEFFEASTVEVSGRVTDNLPLYGPPTTGYTPWPYPPLYFWVTGQLGRLTGVSLATDRAVSFAASLGALLLIGLLVRRISGSTRAGLLAAALFAGSYRVSGTWFDLARVDSLLLLLLLAGWYAAHRARGWRGGLLVGLLFLAAFLTKQNAVLVAVPVIGWLCWRRRPAGVTAALTLAVTSVGSVLVGDAVTGGWYSPYVIAQLPGQGIVPGELVSFWVVDLFLPFAVVALALAVGWAVVRPGRLRGDDSQLLGAAAVGMTLAAWAGRVHTGGAVNTVIPAHAALCVLAAVLGAHLLRHVRERREGTPAPHAAQPDVAGLDVAGLDVAGPDVVRTDSVGRSTSSRSAYSRPVLVAAAALLVGGQVLAMTTWHPSVLPTPADRAAGDQLVAAIRALPGKVLVPGHPYYLRLAGRPVCASTVAVDDLLATRFGPAVGVLRTQLPWSLAGIDAVLLDGPGSEALFGAALRTDFTVVTANLVPPGVFRQVTDVGTVPRMLFVRTSALSALPAWLRPATAAAAASTGTAAASTGRGTP